MNSIPSTAGTAPADEELVALALAGERDTFRRIVERYQTLLCRRRRRARRRYGATHEG